MKTLLVLLLSIIMLMPAFAAMTSDDTTMTPSAKPSMTLCPNIVFAGTPVTKNTLPIPMPGGNPSCSDYGAGGINWWTGWFIVTFYGMTGAFDFACPPNQPYATGFTERWGGYFNPFVIAGGASMTVRCCTNTAISATMSLTQGYKPPGLSGASYDTWVRSTDCP